MATWVAHTEDGLTCLGTFKGKDAMFKAMRERGTGTRFWAAGTTGSRYLYEVTKFGYDAIAASVPEKMQRDGKKRR